MILRGTVENCWRWPTASSILKASFRFFFGWIIKLNCYEEFCSDSLRPFCFIFIFKRKRRSEISSFSLSFHLFLRWMCRSVSFLCQSALSKTNREERARLMHSLSLSFYPHTTVSSCHLLLIIGNWKEELRTEKRIRERWKWFKNIRLPFKGQFYLDYEK